MNKPKLYVDEDGNKYWLLHGKFHREDGPAIEWLSGEKEWFINDKRHREDGPSVELPNGHKGYWLNGKQVDPELFSRLVKLKPLW